MRCRLTVAFHALTVTTAPLRSRELLVMLVLSAQPARIIRTQFPTYLSQLSVSTRLPNTQTRFLASSAHLLVQLEVHHAILAQPVVSALSLVSMQCKHATKALTVVRLVLLCPSNATTDNTWTPIIQSIQTVLIAQKINTAGWMQSLSLTSLMTTK